MRTSACSKSDSRKQRQDKDYEEAGITHGSNPAEALMMMDPDWVSQSSMQAKGNETGRAICTRPMFRGFVFDLMLR